MFWYRLFLILVLSILFYNDLIKPNHESAAFVITIPNHDSRLPRVMELFRRYANISLHPFYGVNGNAHFQKIPKYPLTQGQRGIRETMERFFDMAIRENYNEVLIFQDDAIPHKNFTYLYANLPDRCREADVLLLGASVWYTKATDWPQHACFDASYSVDGAFGLLVKRSAFEPILLWLKRLRFRTFDQIHRYLPKSGLIVRVAYPPFLVIMDVSHPSLADNLRHRYQFDLKARARIHRWNLGDYPITSFEDK